MKLKFRGLDGLEIIETEDVLRVDQRDVGGCFVVLKDVEAVTLMAPAPLVRLVVASPADHPELWAS